MDNDHIAKQTADGANTKDPSSEKSLQHICAASSYSLAGLRTAWHDEKAFRLVCCETLFLAALACVLAKSWEQFCILFLPIVLPIPVELLNSALENVVDRISKERHPLSKKAKDLGSAAQFACQIIICFVWGAFFLTRIFSE